MPSPPNDIWVTVFTAKPFLKSSRQHKAVFNRVKAVFLFLHLKRAVTEPELPVSEAPSKTVTGHGEWCLFMSHFYLPSGDWEKWEWRRESPVVTREELCEDTSQFGVVVKKTRY